MSNDKTDISGNFNTRPQKETLAPKDFDIVINKKTAEIWVLHSTPLINQDIVARAEYNCSDHRLKFVSKDGNMQYLGATVQETLRPHLEKASQISAILMDQNGKIKNAFMVPLLRIEQ